jgi:uroporphyrinogen-III decarboxylase
LRDNTTEISQTRKAINALNSIWWHKNITKNRKFIKTIIQSILMYGAEVWQIATGEINKVLSTEMDVFMRTARKSSLERIKNKHIKEIMGVKGKTDIIDIIEKKRLQWYSHVKRMPEERIPKLIMELIPEERRKGGRPRKRWMEGVQAAMTTRNLEPNQWRNREEWRLVCGSRGQLL